MNESPSLTVVAGTEEADPGGQQASSALASGRSQKTLAASRHSLQRQMGSLVPTFLEAAAKPGSFVSRVVAAERAAGDSPKEEASRTSIVLQRGAFLLHMRRRQEIRHQALDPRRLL